MSFRPEQLFQTAALSRDDVFVGLVCGVDGNAGDTKHFRTAFRDSLFWEELPYPRARSYCLSLRD